MTQDQFQHKKGVGGFNRVSGAEAIASTNSGNRYVPFIDRPPQEMKSEVAITKCPNYSQAGYCVRETIALLGGMERFCRKGDVVVIKPNACGPFPAETADTTHPAVVGEVVKLFKEAGAIVELLERPGFNQPIDQVYESTGIKKAALEAGADELWDWEKEEYVEVDVPRPRSFAKVKLPRTLMEADAFVDIPKLKNNPLIAGLTLGIKSKLGPIPCEDRPIYHRTPADMASGCCDIAKAIEHLHCLTLVDGVVGQEGITHLGPVCTPGIIVASPDLVAVEAVCHTITGYHPLESPGVQIAMKDGLGTGEIEEMEILGTRLQDVYYPFQKGHMRYVQKYSNVQEYFGGICRACLLGMAGVPPIVDPDKKYAVISGPRALVAETLSDVDEVYLVGECACRADHQFPGFMDKVRAAGKVISMGTCPGHSSIEKRKWGGIYDIPMLLSADMCANSTLPETVRHNVLKAAYARRDGK